MEGPIILGILTLFGLSLGMLIDAIFTPFNGALARRKPDDK